FMLRVGIFGYWMNSYWGGAVPAIGGALMLGALARIWRKNKTVHLATWALGIGILTTSRPYDGIVLMLGTFAVLVLWHRKLAPVFDVKHCLPAAAILLVAFTTTAFYNHRVTGHAFTMPYQLHDQQYNVAPMFYTMPLRPEPVYRHAVMRDFWTGWNVEQW